MKLIEHVPRGISAMEDIEDPRGAEVRRLRERLRDVEARHFDRAANGEGGLR